MKQIVFYLLLIFIFSCKSNEKTVDKSSKIFVLSEYLNKGQIDIETLPDSVEVEVTSFTFNPDYIMGNVHFLILNENQAFYSQNSPIPFGDFNCLTGTEEDSRNDSIAAIEYNVKSLDNIRPISIASIQKVISTNNELNENNSTINIFSFALKEDTLKVNYFSELVNQLENDKRSRILIRRMNNKELEAVENYSE